MPSIAASIGSGALGVARLNAMLFGLLGRSPRDTFALVLAAAAAAAIVVNALYMQPGPHPAPIFSVKPRPVAPSEPAAVPRVRPDAAPAKAAVPPGRSRAEITADIQRELARRGLYDGPADGVLGAKTDAAIRDFETLANMKVTGEPSEEVLHAILALPLKTVPVPRAAPSRDPIAEMIAPTARVTAVQRALNDYGYGPVKVNGIYGADTVAAIEKFERDRKLPITGQISTRLLRELASLTGRPLE